MQRGIAAVLALTLCGSITAAAQAPNPDFEDGLRGWTRTGNAFDAQPVPGSGVTTDSASAVSLGGDYWRRLPYPIGQHGRYLVRSSDAGRGTLTSSAFFLGRGDRYFSVLVGGPSDPAHERVELQVLARSGEERAELKRDGDYLVVVPVTGPGGERLQEISQPLPEWVSGRLARIRIVDDSDARGAHINVDHVRFTSQAPDAVHAPVWGLADYHTHVMTHMGFGAVNGIRTIWGAPGRGYDEYVGTSPQRHEGDDIPRCVHGHFGGPSAEPVINATEGRFVEGGLWASLWALITGRVTSHGSSGGPDFVDFPSFTSGMHEQMHITQIHRAWEGGLRLMTVLAIHNRGLEFLVSAPANGRIDPSTERQVLEAQLCGIRQLAIRNHSWMAIAYSPADARRIIETGKLAVVLGVEMDDLGRLDGFGGSIPDEVQYLWDAGIRQVTPVHAVNNRLGSAAVFEPIYNSLNDLFNRGEMNLRGGDLPDWPAKFFGVTEGGCTKGPLAGQPGECVLYRLDRTQKRSVLTKWSPFSLFRLSPYFESVSVAGYGVVDGMMNADGLTWDGAVYLRELMKRGMLIGLEHMGQRTVDDVYGVVGEELERTDRECAGFGRRDLKASCYEAAYPLIFSHAHFRELSAPLRTATTVEGFMPSEYEVGLHELTMLQRTGGVVGQFAAEDPVWPAKMPFANDCGGSSKSVAHSLLYALEKMNDAGVGLATDFTLIHGTAPRFGPFKCAAYLEASSPDEERKKFPDQYNFDQHHPVEYSKKPNDGLLVQYQMEGRSYDFNVDGLASYGLLPDLLQDLKNVGLPPAAFTSLFSSAEAYIQTWEKAERVAGLSPRVTFTPADIDCDRACHGLCPDSPNAGAPVTNRQASTRRPEKVRWVASPAGIPSTIAWLLISLIV